MTKRNAIIKTIIGLAMVCGLLAIFVGLYLQHTEKAMHAELQQLASDLSATPVPVTPAPEAEESDEEEQPCSEHKWEGGVCTVCGERCLHEEHDEITAVCKRCGEQVSHRYVNGVCACGYAMPLVDDLWSLPDSVFAVCDRPGTIDTYCFDDKTFELIDPPESRRVKTYHQLEFTVYTPYDYDENKQYDVLVLNHGLNNTCHFWLETEHPMSTKVETANGKQIVDNMIAQGIAEPMIIVCMEYHYQVPRTQLVEHINTILRDHVLPFVVEHYSTYTTLDDAGAVIPAREHFGYVGASLSSDMNWNGVMVSNLDLFGYWACLSGNAYDMQRIANDLDEAGVAELPIHFLYCSAGGAEENFNGQKGRYDKLIDYSDAITDGVNARFDIIHAGTHGFRTWAPSLYNIMLLFFNNSPLGE